MEFIRLKGVTKEYKDRIILNDVNLTLEVGDTLGVIGQSGSGKTTLLNLLVGFIEPSEGEVVYRSVTGDEKNLHKNLWAIKRSIGFTPQHNSFYHKLTVEENLYHFGKLYGVPLQRLNTNIQNLLNFTKLIDYRKMLADHLSGGMQKRLDISCSLVHKPKLLILDEPTADLDPILQKEVLHLLQEVNKQGVTIVMASHQLESVEWLCNKVAIIHQSTVHTHGFLEDIKKPFVGDHFTIKVPSGKNKDALIERFKSLPVRKIVDKGKNLVIYPEHVERTVNSILNLIREENLNLCNVDMNAPSLREIFEHIVLSKEE